MCVATLRKRSEIYDGTIGWSSEVIELSSDSCCAVPASELLRKWKQMMPTASNECRLQERNIALELSGGTRRTQTALWRCCAVEFVWVEGV